jgi:hypothetical protein
MRAQWDTETIPQFIARRGSVFTSDVSLRFGMTPKAARVLLRSYEKAGQIHSRPSQQNFGGDWLVWEPGPGPVNSRDKQRHRRKVVFQRPSA